MRKHRKIIVVAVICILVLQAGYAVFAAVSDVPSLQKAAPASQETKDNAAYQSEDDVKIDTQVINQIKDNQPSGDDRVISAYKSLLVSLQVHPLMKAEIEKLVQEGHPLSEIMIGYTFLYHSFGTVSDLKSFVDQQAKGTSWKEIFTEYDRSHKEFQPRSFDSDYLEKLMSTASVTADDVMIADHLSVVSGKSFDELIEQKQNSLHWNVVAANLGILYGADTLPRVQIKTEQLKSFQESTGLSEEQITDAFVLADKVGKDPKVVISLIKQGESAEAIFAESYEDKYR
ncbi:hypothetical protein [Gorillibacterium massiliense]|uniref:hypothetical protein n=1 Tax=Gorillibacterium massiliense TaxID=1280390 RepID=UPI0004B53FFF|nr:hypothetical protein [Gorillibacterium massiliense]